MRGIVHLPTMGESRAKFRMSTGTARGQRCGRSQFNTNEDALSFGRTCSIASHIHCMWIPSSIVPAARTAIWVPLLSFPKILLCEKDKTWSESYTTIWSFVYVIDLPCISMIMYLYDGMAHCPKSNNAPQSIWVCQPGCQAQLANTLQREL